MSKLQILISFLQTLSLRKEPCTHVRSNTIGVIKTEASEGFNRAMRFGGYPRGNFISFTAMNGFSSNDNDRNINSNDGNMKSLEDMEKVITVSGLKEAVEKWTPLEGENYPSTPADMVWVSNDVIEALGGLDYVMRNAAHLKGELEWCMSGEGTPYNGLREVFNKM